MKKILLLCAAGMSTSILVENMKKAAEKERFACTIEAHSTSEASNHLDADCVLLGPQVRFHLKKIQQQFSCSVEAIDMRDYGTMNGEKVLKHARELMGV